MRFRAFRLFKRRQRFETGTIRKHKLWEIFKKSFLLVIAPLPITSVIMLIWHYGMFKHEFYFDEKMRDIITTAVIPTFGIMYSIIALKVIETVWDEYRRMRAAVKSYDFDTFIDLRDESISPLMHILVGTVSTILLASFMSIHYPSWLDGAIVIAGVTYVFTLFFLVANEIDDPCAGLWYIRHIPEAWLRVDPKKWRKHRQKKLEQEFQAQFEALHAEYEKSTAANGTVTERVTLDLKPAAVGKNAVDNKVAIEN